MKTIILDVLQATSSIRTNELESNFNIRSGRYIFYTEITDNGFIAKNMSDKPISAMIRFVNLNGTKDKTELCRFSPNRSREIRNPFPGENVSSSIYDEKISPRDAPMSAIDNIYIDTHDQSEDGYWYMINPTEKYILFSFDTIDKITNQPHGSFYFLCRPYAKFPFAFPDENIKVVWYGASFEPY
ncbi:hypothetical protein ACIMOF_04160 [Escherichia coli]